MHITKPIFGRRNKQHIVLCMLIGAMTLAVSTALAADFDLCGCANHPDSLGAFDSNDPATWPPGTEIPKNENWRMYIPLPPDGVLVFDSFKAERWRDRNSEIWFKPNAANTPVTLLVAGDFTLGRNVRLRLDGRDGTDGTHKVNGRGGLGGPGGFRGGDGAYQDVNGKGDGGEGLGPAGGTPGTESAFDKGAAGRFSGRQELLPLIGGSGGGGGASKASGKCSASGGGGGGGAILIAANGTLRIDRNGGINADGGHPGTHVSDGKCATQGGPGSGGAIRLVAQNVTGGGHLVARGNRDRSGGHHGVIRIESINEETMDPDRITPPAIRTNVIGPLVNPISSTVAITAVAGQVVPEVLRGWKAGMDVIVPAPGVVKLQLATTGVPAGTTIEVALKPKVGGPAIRDRTVLNASNCNPKGECTAFISFELPKGAYFAEATATFQTP